MLLSRSKDGVAFGTPVTLVERAGVPCVIQERSGRLAAVFQWFPFSDRAAFDRVAIVFSTDSGRSWSAPQTVTVTGMPADLMRPFDPAIVQLEDGRYRLYFTSNARSGPGVPAIYSAISDDAVQFRFEAGARFAPAQGTVDASVVFFAGAWHLFSHNQRANTGLGYHAVSDDGLSFRQLADVNIGAGKQWIGNATVAGGLLRYYGSGVDGVWSATSSDGAAWTLEQGVRVAGGDASAVFLPGGEVVLLAVGPLRADAGPAPF